MMTVFVGVEGGGERGRCTAQPSSVLLVRCTSFFFFFFVFFLRFGLAVSLIAIAVPVVVVVVASAAAAAIVISFLLFSSLLQSVLPNSTHR